MRENLTQTYKEVSMKTNLSSGILMRAAPVVLCFLLAFGASAVAQSRPGNSQGGLAAPIAGTWILSIHRVTQGITFSALQSFSAGGVTVATGTIDRTPPPPISPLYGSWRHTSDKSYVATICFFLFDSAGNALAMIKTPEDFQMIDRNHLTGSGTALACDINGENCVNVNSPITITGKRLIAQGSN
jgi:hypothetical protein